MNTATALIDIHIHGTTDADTATGNTDDILRIAHYQQSQGIEKIILTIYPNKIDIMRKNMETIKTAIEMAREKNLTDCAEMLGVHVEGPFLNPKMAGALDARLFLPPSQRTLETLIDGYEDIIKIITVAPELKGAHRVIKHCRNSGINVNMGHSDATFREAEKGKKAGAQGVTHLFNAMRPFHHREPGLSGFGLLDRDTYVEIIADGIHLDLHTLQLVFTVKPPNRIILISDAVKGERADDGAVYLDSRKLAGSGISLKDGVHFLIKNGFDRESVIMAASANPLHYIGLV